MDIRRYSHGVTKEAEFNSSEPIEVHMYWTNIPANITLLANQNDATWWFIASLSIDEDEARSSYEDAEGNKEQLLNDNANDWKNIWESGQIVVMNNVTLAQTINACFFHIMISTPDDIDSKNPFAGLSPGLKALSPYTI